MSNNKLKPLSCKNTRNMFPKEQRGFFANVTHVGYEIIATERGYKSLIFEIDTIDNRREVRGTTKQESDYLHKKVTDILGGALYRATTPITLINNMLSEHFYKILSAEEMCTNHPEIIIQIMKKGARKW